MGASFALATPNIRLRRRLTKDNNITRLFQYYYTFVTLQRCGSKRPTKTHLLQKKYKKQPLHMRKRASNPPFLLL